VLLLRCARQRQQDRIGRLREAARALHAVSPLRTLDRGYAILRDAGDGRVLATAAQVRVSTRVVGQLADGRVMLMPLDGLSPATGQDGGAGRQ
jgi:exodeoxyribonuclease VII large subunit